MRNDLVLVRGGGRLGTAVAHRLRVAGLPVVITEAARPTLLHHRAAFGAAIYESEVTVEEVPARRAAGPDGVRQILEGGQIPVIVDPAAASRESLRPWVLVDATGLDRNVGTRLSDAPIVIGLGPGFAAGEDVHAVVDHRPGADLGRFGLEGTVTPEPLVALFSVDVSGLVVSPAVGRFDAARRPGDAIQKGEMIGRVGDRQIPSPVDGLVAGLLMDGLFVGTGIRLADIDRRGDPRMLDRIDPMARAAAGGVLEAIFYLAAVGASPGQALAPPEKPA